MLRLRHTICLVATLLGCQNASSSRDAGSAPEQLDAVSSAVCESVTIDAHPNPDQSVENSHRQRANNRIQPPAIRQLVSNLAVIDDEDFGKFSLEKQERWNAVFTELQQLPGATAAAMRQMLKSDNSYSRACAADVLGKSKAIVAVNDLVNALRDRNITVRSSAALALGWLGDDTAVPALVDAMEDEHRTVREQAASALGYFGSPQATTSLIAAIKINEDGPACGVYAPLVIVSMWREGHPGRYNSPVSWSLVQIGPPAVEELSKALEDKTGSNHAYLAWSLAEIAKKHCDIQALRALVLARDHTNRDVREFVDESLDEIKASNDPQLKNLKEMIPRLERERNPRHNDEKSDSNK